jgi:hypothetical protein
MIAIARAPPVSQIRGSPRAASVMGGPFGRERRAEHDPGGDLAGSPATDQLNRSDGLRP